MKKSFLFVFLTLTSFVFVSNNVSAVDCDTWGNYQWCSSWSSPSGDDPQIVTRLAEEVGSTIYDCFFKVNYKKRTCFDGNDTIFQLKLEDVVLLGDNCNQFTKDEVLEQAQKELLTHARWIFDPNLSVAATWSVDMYTPGCVESINDTYSGCSDECCKTTYEITQTETGVEVVDFQATQFNGTCTGSPTGSGCETVCDVYVPKGLISLTDTFTSLCEGDCSEQWESRYPYFVTYWYGKDQQTCWIQVYYHFRECDNVYEIRIDRIVDGTYGLYCGYTDSDSLMHNAIVAIARESDFILDETFNPSIIYDLVHSCCWKPVLSSQNKVIALYPCYEDDCCVTNYNVTRNSGLYTIYGDNSSGCSSVICNSPCEEMCSNFSDFYDQRYKQNMGYEDKLKTSDLEGKYFSTVKPNPTEGKIEFVLKGTDSGQFKLKVFDYIGNMIIDLKVEKKSYSANTIIDMQNYAEGIYYFNFLKDGENVTGGSFVIQK